MKRTFFLLLFILSTTVYAAETLIGHGYEINGFEVGAVYLQPVTMAPTPASSPQPSPFQAHLELDIHALKNNPYGFKVDEWIPYLTVNYELQKLNPQGTPITSQKGILLPMAANDGPHYGQNVLFPGAGKYRLTYEILPPSIEGFLRHTDKETGIPPWFKPIKAQWEFVFLGTGKKGGY